MSNEKNPKKGQEQKESGQKGQYDLYTEKIVKSPWNKLKRVIRHGAKVVGSAIVFGVVASLVMALVYPNLRKFAGEEETTTRPRVVLPTDSQTYDESDYARNETGETSGEGELEREPDTGNGFITEPSDEGTTETDPGGTETVTEPLGLAEMGMDEFNALLEERMQEALSGYKPGVNELNSMYMGLRSVISDLNKSTVTVLLSDNGGDWIEAAGMPQRRVFGVIVAEDEEFFYILTLLNFVESRAYLAVSYNDGTITNAEYLAGDRTTNIAVLSAAKAEFEAIKPNLVKAAALGNSYLVQQGDQLVLMGNIYGQMNMAAYTMAAATRNTLMDTDSNYRLIYTDAAASETDCGILANTSGEIVGIIVAYNDASAGKIISAYGISELKVLLDRLINGKVTPYVGILPQNVTTAMQSLYDMPKGVYVDSIELGSPAYVGGIQSGDVITAVDGTAIVSVRELQAAVFEAEPGSSAEFTISRPGKDGYREVKIIVELGVE